MKLTRSLRFALLATAATFACAGCSMFGGLMGGTPPNPNPTSWVPETPQTDGVEYVRIRPLQNGDQVVISIIPPNSAAQKIEDIVDEYGIVTLPLIGDIRLGSYTTSEGEKLIRSALIEGGIYQNVNVTVNCPTMVSELGRMYYMTGCTRNRGQFPFRDGMTLREAVIAAGDLTDFANGKIVITRNGKQLKYDLDRIKANRDPDPVLRSRDIIEAKERIF